MIRENTEERVRCILLTQQLGMVNHPQPPKNLRVKECEQLPLKSLKKSISPRPPDKSPEPQS
jgi:hypothetical protein